MKYIHQCKHNCACRRMFPTLAFKVSGLDPRETYSCKMHMLPADHRRYKFLQSEWVAVGRSDKKQIYCEYEHPDSPNSGSYWTDKIVAFKLVKLTNNKGTKVSEQVIHILYKCSNFQPLLLQ